MVCARTASAPLLAAALVAALAVACSLVSGAYAAAEQEAAGAGGNDLRLRQPPITRGLSFDFYKRSCPMAESIVRHFVRDAVRKDVGLAAGLLRLHFHDCFVQGCGRARVMHACRAATGPGEQRAPPNLTLRPSAFKAINDIRDRLERECRGAVVSCSDILTLAARDSVVATGGPEYRVPLGRHDSPRFATPQDVLSGLPAPTSAVPSLLDVFHNHSLHLDATDLVALSGGHTVGLGHCASFEGRLFPRPDLLRRLRRTCPAKGTDARTVLDVHTPDVFDNKYYVYLVNLEGLFVSCQDLFTIVERLARSQRYFFSQLGASITTGKSRFPVC
ncbi:cationic peroxidase SPC4-like [Triticum aestivum]|uniref:cationic peroxidase SPC4-like n=1 Tax=Triticum aestivum TaxID=4565 RepID=UPI001D0178A2|nr:cationic peroxidase SPC4-like [Triticum aestivum]